MGIRLKLKKQFLHHLFSVYEYFINRYAWHKYVSRVKKHGHEVEFEPGFRIYHGAEHVVIGNRVMLSDALINAGAGAGVVIEDDVFFGHQVMLLARTHDLKATQGRRKQTITGSAIHIKKGAWIASRATILSGVTIGENAVVAAGSIVTSDVPHDVLVGGIPAKKIRQLE